MTRKPVTERIMKKVTIQPNGCWEWTGATFFGGYGNVGIWKGDRWGNTSTHRAMYEAKYGPVPEGLNLLHRCDNPPCCNPDHVYPGTQADNLEDMTQKGRRSWGSNHATKLTAEDVEAIRASRESQRVLAERYGVWQSTISKIKNHLRWADPAEKSN